MSIFRRSHPHNFAIKNTQNQLTVVKCVNTKYTSLIVATFKLQKKQQVLASLKKPYKIKLHQDLQLL